MDAVVFDGDIAVHIIVRTSCPASLQAGSVNVIGRTMGNKACAGQCVAK